MKFSHLAYAITILLGSLALSSQQHEVFPGYP